MLNWFKRWQQWMRHPVVSCVVAVLSCLFLPVAYSCMAEFVRTASVHYLLLYLEAHTVQLALGIVVLMLLFGVVMILSARPWVANLIVGGILCFGSWANLQKLRYRGEPVLPKDLFQFSAAAGIAKEINFTIQRETWLFLALLVLATVVLLPVKLPFGRGKKGWLGRIGLTVCLAAMLVGYMKGIIYDRDSMSRKGAYIVINSMPDTYYRNGFVTSFCILTGSMFREEKPDGYSRQAVVEAVELLQDTSVSDDAQRECDVIVVLLESYYELLNYAGATYSEPLNSNWQRLCSEGISGQMLTEVYGGGTANVEFSVLSGFSYSMLAVGSTPYFEYIDNNFLCYPQYLKAQGYQTLALHPYKRGFYNRENSYPRMGIDTFVTEEAFLPQDTVGNYIGEMPTFVKAMELYSEASQNGPVFLHIITMQNHTPNQPDEYPDDHEVKASIPGETEFYNACLSSVATGMRDVDHAVGWFVDELRKSDRDVVVLFFGDHQTTVNGEDAEDLLYHMENYNALSPDEKIWASHVTPYLMWANFETGKAGTDAGVLPPYLLLPTMLNEYDVLRPSWMDWLYSSVETMQPVTFDLMFRDEEKQAELLTDRQKEIHAAQRMLQYDMMFGERYSAELLYNMTK